MLAVSVKKTPKSYLFLLTLVWTWFKKHNIKNPKPLKAKGCLQSEQFPLEHINIWQTILNWKHLTYKQDAKVFKYILGIESFKLNYTTTGKK